jgi:alcohol dehydrogenase class IV
MTQKEYFGFNSIENLKTVISMHPAKNICLVTGKKSYQLSGAEKKLNEILRHHNIFRFYDFSENPKLKDVKKGISFLKEKKCDLLMAVGGGSVIDMAKLINILAAQQGLLQKYINKNDLISKKGRFLAAIPTTAGSGSEATHFAVVYIDKVKYSVAHEHMLPDVVIIDPQFTTSLPPYITASSGMDAFSQAIESYWSVNSTEESKRYSKEAIKLILDNLILAVKSPTKQSRANMAKAAYLAGKAINITKTTAPHAISYAITSYFGVLHGQAVSLTLPAFFVYNYELNKKGNNDKRGVVYVKKTIEEISSLLGCESPYDAKYKILLMMKEIGLKTTLIQLGIKKEVDYQKIIDNVNTERMKNNPRMIKKQNLKIILNRI